MDSLGRCRVLVVSVLMAAGAASAVLAAEPTVEDKAKQVWRLLDYVAVDYGGAIAVGAD